MEHASVHIKRVTLATLIFLVLTVIVVALFSKSPSMQKMKQLEKAQGKQKIQGEQNVKPPPVQLNTQVELARNGGLECKDLWQPDSGFARLRLMVDGMDTGIKAVGCNDTPRNASFEFRHVQPNGLSPEADRAVWDRILGHPLQTLGSNRELHYTVQFVKDGEGPVAVGTETRIVRIFDWWAPAVLMLVLYVWFMLGYLGRVTTMLRDPAPAGTPLANRTFSLARTQMAWWFAVIFASMLFLWLVTGEAPSLSPQALALLGISAATTMASTGVSAGRTQAEGMSGQFFTDLLSDEDGIAIHRFQMLAVTVALGLMFLFSVATTLTMPEFDASLLTLMGLSAGTYVLLKVPEERRAAAAAGETLAPPAPAVPAVPDPKGAYSPTP